MIEKNSIAESDFLANHILPQNNIINIINLQYYQSLCMVSKTQDAITICQNLFCYIVIIIFKPCNKYSRQMFHHLIML